MPSLPHPAAEHLQLPVGRRHLARRGKLEPRVPEELALVAHPSLEASDHAGKPNATAESAGHASLDHAIPPLHTACHGASDRMIGSMPAAIRVIHPAPALAVVLLTAALGAILLSQAGAPLDGRWLLMVISVAGSQAFTGATNDVADAARDAAAGRLEKPIPAGELSVAAGRWVAAGGLAVQLVASAALGPLALLLGAAAMASAAAYNLALSRTPLSPLPYLVSFGLLPLWIAAGVGQPLERVLPAVPLAAAFAAAAHLANTLRDWDADAATGSRSLAQLLGRRRTHRVAVGLALAVGVAMGLALLIGHRAGPSLGLGIAGLVAIATAASSERRLWAALLLAAVAWTAAWGLSSG
jgi:4-hydroxybenzoate polyprenyltransferase